MASRRQFWKKKSNTTLFWFCSFFSTNSMRNFWQQILLSKIVFPVREILFHEKLRHIQQTNKIHQTPCIPSAEECGWGLCDASRQTWWRPAETCRLLPIGCCSLSWGCVFLTASFAFKLATMELCDQLSTIQKEVWLYERRNYNIDKQPILFQDPHLLQFRELSWF